MIVPTNSYNKNNLNKTPNKIVPSPPDIKTGLLSGQKADTPMPAGFKGALDSSSGVKDGTKGGGLLGHRAITTVGMF